MEWRSASGAEKELSRFGELRCWLALPDAGQDEEVPAVVRLEPDDSTVVVELFADAPGWPNRVGGRGEFTFHGRTTSEGHEFTLIEPYVSRGSTRGVDDHQPLSLRGGRLALGAHVDAASTWSLARYRTGRLHEWFGQSGMSRNVEFDDDKRLIVAVEQRWTMPETLTVARPGWVLTFNGVLAEDAAAGPQEAISLMRSETEVVVRVDEPMTHDELYRSFGLPLVAFTTLASSRPDWLLLDVATDRGRQETVRFVHQGDVPSDWSWQADRRFLFKASDLDDPAEFFSRWLDLWPEIKYPAATFGEALRSGATYSRSRVVDLVAALEAYWRIRIRGPQRNYAAKIKALAEYSGIDREILAAGNQQVADLVKARNLYAHLNDEPADEQNRLDALMIDNARRAALLFQACVLRDLDVPPRKVTEWIQRHLNDWPIA